MSKGRESLAFVKDRQVVLLIKHILEFLLYSGQALTCGLVGEQKVFWSLLSRCVLQSCGIQLQASGRCVCVDWG